MASKDIKLAPKNIHPNRRQTNPMIAIWKVLKEFLPDIVWEPLIDGYLSIAENKPFLICAIVCVLFQVRYETVNINEIYNSWLREDIGSSILSGFYPLKIDDYIIDNHTKKDMRSLARLNTIINVEDK